MNPGCMLLFVFGFVGGAVVINSAILVSLSVLLLVHFSISTGVPALTQNLPRILRKERPISLGIFPLPPGDALLTPEAQREAGETPGSEHWKFHELSQPRSHTSLKVSGQCLQWEVAQSKLQEGRNGGVVLEGSKSGSPDQPEELQNIGNFLQSGSMFSFCLLDDVCVISLHSTPTKGIENKAFDRNTESLFEELSSAGSGLIGDVDEGADLLGKKGYLMMLFTGVFLVSEIYLCCVFLSRARAEAEEARQKAKEDDDSDVPTAQRKRFTRVEMARVLMERNQYKERLMELQEAVRWTEMIRASRENPAMQEKKRSSIWQFFSRLFSSSSNTAKKPEPPVNVKYNAPTSHITPSVKKRSSTLSQLPSDKSKAFEFLSDETEASLASRREQKREQYRQVKAHVQKEDGRVQAFGWSLPQKYKQAANGGQGDNKMKNLPVPVYLRPLDEKDTSMKLWCAVGVNLSGGKTRDGGSVVGASVFYNDVAGTEADGNKQRTGSQSSLDRLDQELKDQQKELKHQEDLSSLVWICTSTHSATKVIIIDANQPGNILDSFIVCNSHVLCIASVPGARETDYPAGEEGSQEVDPNQVDKSSLCGSMTSNSSAETDSMLGGITVVGCTAEGVTGAPVAHSANGASPMAEKHNSVDDNIPTAEEATEATEVSAGTEDITDIGQTGVYTEHVFTDPLGVQNTEASPVYQPGTESELYKDVAVLPNEQDLVREEAQKMSSLLPTMWLGTQNGCLYVHSSVAHWRKCIHAIKLKDSILSIVHVKGIVLVALADGTLAIFHRGVDGQWDLTNYHLLDLGRPHHSIRCMTVVHDKVWCGYRNKIYVVQPKAMKIEKSFDAHPRRESQVRQLAWVGDGVWVSIRLDSTLRLYHAHTYQHLQDVDIEPYVSKMLGKLIRKSVVTCLSPPIQVHNLTEVLYCKSGCHFFSSMWRYVFIVRLNQSCCFSGDEGGESELLGEALQLEPSVAKAERSHLIVWQVMYGSE
uniref:Sperm associated antigen 9 n=1 Tax=Pavo cristatus TaxID=9049 RepID=A0A8C9LBF8_PAVCR